MKEKQPSPSLQRVCHNIVTVHGFLCIFFFLHFPWIQVDMLGTVNFSHILKCREGRRILWRLLRYKSPDWNKFME